MVRADPLLDLRAAFLNNLSITYHSDDGTVVDSLDSPSFALISIPIPMDDTRSTSASASTSVHVYPRSTPTNFLSKRGTGPPHLLDSICLLLEKRDESFTEYLQEARRCGVGVVNLVDRRDVIDYVTTSNATSQFIDNSLELPEARTTFLPEAKEYLKAVVEEDQDYKVKVCRARTREFLMTCEDDSKDFSWIGKLAKSCVDRAIEQQKKERQMIEEHKVKKEKTSLLDDLRQQSQQQKRDINQHDRSVHSAPRTVAKGSWIVLLPSSANALITMYNAKRFFVDGVFQPASELRSKGKEPVLSVPHPQTHHPIQFIDNPLRLTPSDWALVRLCIVSGEEWQFKGWRYGDTPQDNLSHINGAYFYYEDEEAEWRRRGEVGKWKVRGIALSRSKRHADQRALMQFWDLLT